MFKSPALAAAAVAFGLHSSQSGAWQETETVVRGFPPGHVTITVHYVAHDAGLFQNEGRGSTGRGPVGVTSPGAVPTASADLTIGTDPVFLRAPGPAERCGGRIVC